MVDNRRHRIPFGQLSIGPLARERIERALKKTWVTEGDNVAEFEEKFAARFGWKHCVATSSGTTAGEIVWAAIRELKERERRLDELGNGEVITPACAFVSTANCLLANRLEPMFVDVQVDTLNLNLRLVRDVLDICEPIGIQFVATMGKPTPIGLIAELADQFNIPLVADMCEAHGAQLLGGRHYADKYARAAIYSFYVAHLVQGGEGGCVCTDDDVIAALCRSIKSHGRYAGSNYFDFRRPGFNAKWNELCAALAIESLEKFGETFARRREVRAKLVRALERYESELILYRDAEGETISPHAFPIVLRDESADIGPLCSHMQDAGVEVKTLFGSLPTQHRAFDFLGHEPGDFPVAERVGRMGLHFGCHEHMADEDVDYVAKTIGDFLVESR